MQTKKTKTIEANPLVHEGFNNIITISLVGGGGTGSLLLSTLARLSTAMYALRGIRIQLALFDNETVTMANHGRQAFSLYDTTRYKATVLCERINRFYGFEWLAVIKKWPQDAFLFSNYIITCTDNIQARLDTAEFIRNYLKEKESDDHSMRFGYWIDCGNTFDTGNVIIGDGSPDLPFVTDYPHFQKLLDKPKKKEGPSCSLAEAIGKQHIMINSMVANAAATMIWDIFTTKTLKNKGYWLSTSPMNIKQIKITDNGQTNTDALHDLPGADT